MAVEVPATNPTLQMIVAFDQGGGEPNVGYLTTSAPLLAHTGTFDAGWDLTARRFRIPVR